MSECLIVWYIYGMLLTLHGWCLGREPVGGDEERCPMDPYEILGEKSLHVNQQTLKLQEAPELVPTGELPRHVIVSADRYVQ